MAGHSETAESSTAEFQATARRALAIGIVLVGTLAEVLGSARPAAAQTTTATTPTISITNQPAARLIEWDLPSQGGDAEPGAVVVDTRGEDQNRVWFVTRLFNPNLYLLETPNSLMTGDARWTAWQLDALLSGGLKKVRASHDRRFVYVRTVSTSLAAALERIDTQNCSGGSCERTEWSDPNEVGMDVSDVAVDDDNNVFMTHSPMDDPTQSYVQELTPATTSGGNATVTRWNVGGGAGLCGTGTGFDPGSESSPCISGIAVDPNNPNLIYYSEPFDNNIGQLNTSTSQVRRWSLNALSLAVCPNPCSTPITGPRQLQIDRRGKVWVVTGSGHLVSLDPCTNQMASHQMPDSVSADPFGVAPDDDVVGYTAASSGINKVGMLLPNAQTFGIYPGPAVGATKTTTSMVSQVSRATVACGYVCPRGKTVQAQVTKKPDGTFIEAEIFTNGNDSQRPLGVTSVQAKSQGTYFYAVGMNSSVTTDPSTGATVPANRVGFARLPVLERIKHPRDDDDSNDGAVGDTSWHNWHGHDADDDNDDDGFENEYDSPAAHENVQRGDSTPLQGGQTMDYQLIASATTLALIAKAEADDPLAQIGVEIHDVNGLLVANSQPTPGVAVVTVLLPAAGTYTCRVRNYALSPVNQTPTLIVREPWAQ